MEPHPRLSCNIIDSSSGEPKKPTFEAVQSAWGKCVPLEGSDGIYVIEEGPAGFCEDSSSDLILSFWANAENLTSSELTVSLSILNTTLTRYEYQKELGEDLILFSASTTDKDHVLTLKDRPTSSPRPQIALSVDAPDTNVDPDQHCIITVRGSNKDGTNIREIKARVQVKSEFEKAALAKGIKATTSQLGPCTLQLQFQRTAYTIVFPYPFLKTMVSVEMHPKSHEIEVIAQVLKDISIKAGGYPENRFPVVQHTTCSPWNIHHVHLHRLPLIDIQQRDKLNWLIVHTSAQISNRERIIQRSKHATQRTPDEVLVNLKETLNVFVLDYIVPRQGPVRIFALTDVMHGYFCFIFVLGLRLGLTGSTVVMDTALVPIHLKGAAELSPALTIINSSGQALMKPRTRPTEVIAWKHLLQAFVERCRTWSHKPNCEYKSTGKFSLGVKPEVNPICSCGQGVGFNEPEWEDPA